MSDDFAPNPFLSSLSEAISLLNSKQMFVGKQAALLQANASFAAGKSMGLLYSKQLLIAFGATKMGLGTAKPMALGQCDEVGANANPFL